MSSVRSDSSKGSGIKRKKNFYKSFGGKRTKFTPFKEGVKGFLVTCNKSENHAVKEAFWLLNKYADELEKLTESTIKEETVTGGDEKPVEVKEEEKVTPKEEDKVSGDNVDLELELKKEVDKMKDSRKRFCQLTTKTHNVVFIEAKEPSLQPNSLVDLLFNEIKSNSNFGVRFCLKMLPVLMTCGAFIETIKKTFITLLDSQPEEASYYIIPKIRANTSITREEIITAIGEACTEKRPSWNPDFDNPKLTIVINIVNKMCCFSVLENFNSFKKYNPVEFTIALGNKIIKPTTLTTSNEPEGKKDAKGQSKGAGGTKARGRVKANKSR